MKVERVSDAAGRFFLPALPVGEYTITAELSGFRQFSQRGLTLRVGQKIELSVTLQIGQLTDAVTVTGEAPLLRTVNAEIAEVIDNRQVEQLPLNGRQFIQLAQLTDGVTIPPGGTRGAALGQAGPLPNVYGQRGGHNIYLIDGVKVTDELFNNLVISPSVDAIQEFKIQKTMYPAEFGGKASALINVVTKSGGNSFHGSALEFVRNEKFDAHNYFDDPTKPMPPLRQNQFGVNVGGPLKRDRTFFFFSYEGQRIRKAQTQTFSVPTAALRNGDFSGLTAALRSADAYRCRHVHSVCRQSDSGKPSESGRQGAPGQGAAADERRSCPESSRRGRPGEPDEPVQPQDRPPPRGERQPVRPGHHLPRARHAAVRHDVAERGARPRFRANGDHQERERRPRLHARVRIELVERSPLRLPERPRRAGRVPIKAWTSRRCPACRA